MPKHAIRIPALRAGRRVRWMFEVSADVGEGVVRTQKTSKEHTRSKATTRGSRRIPRKKSLMDTDGPTKARPSVPILAPVAPLPSRTTGREMFLATVIGVVFVAGTTVALMGYPSRRLATDARSTTVARRAQPEVLAQPIQIATPVQAATLAPALPAPARAPKAIVEKSTPTPITTLRSRAADDVPVATPPAVKATPSAVSPAPDSVGSERSTNASAIAPPATTTNQTVTISGCLETTAGENQFRLTGTEGAGAPKARSWKSGFLKKGSASVDLLEFSDAPMLRKYVGHRVVVTGLLTGRQMHVRSVQAGGSSCD